MKIPLPPNVPNPAKRALESVNIFFLEDLALTSELQLLALHGFGPKALKILKESMAINGINFIEKK